jgi:hypothetical protein
MGLETVVPVAACLFLEGLAEDSHRSVEIASDRSQNVVHRTLPRTGKVEIRRIGPRRRDVGLENREVDALVAVGQRVDLGEHNVVGEASIVLPGMVVL